MQCENQVTLSEFGIYRFDSNPSVPRNIDDVCSFKVFGGAATVRLATVSSILKAGTRMGLNRHCGDMIPTYHFDTGPRDAFDRRSPRLRVPCERVGNRIPLHPAESSFRSGAISCPFWHHQTSCNDIEYRSTASAPVKAIHEKEGRLMGAVVSELLADVLARPSSVVERTSGFRWTLRPMNALIRPRGQRCLARSPPYRRFVHHPRAGPGYSMTPPNKLLWHGDGPDGDPPYGRPRFLARRGSKS